MTDLPNPQPKFMPYLSIIPTRRPTQKTHANIGHAKNAVNGKMSRYRGAECAMQVFEYKNDGWQLLYDIKEGDREAPWRAGEIAAEELRKSVAAKRETQRLWDVASRVANKLYTEAYGSDGSRTEHSRGDYVSGYVQGYMNARQELGKG